MTSDTFYEIVKWQEVTFPDATSLSKVKHLKEEVKELEQELLHTNPLSFEPSLEIESEIADCLFLIYGAAFKAGLSYSQIEFALRRKLAVNKNRKWGKPDADGVVKHVE
jgi:NTP pyrophosphatase (non-canonical NTP hydrolase)